jgi:hypothetical protein
MNMTEIKREDSLSLWWAVLLVYALLLPQQIFVMAGNLIVFPYRLLLICMVPGIVSLYVNRNIKASFADVLMVASIFWIFLSLTITTGPAKAFASGGSSLIDIGVAYFAARCTITSGLRAQILLSRVGPAILVAGLSIILETVTGQYLVQPFTAKLFGVRSPTELFNLASDRFGLIRGTGPFAHPILAGLQLASVLPLYLLVKMRFLPRMIGVLAAVCALATVSSSALIALFLAGGLVGYEYFGAQLTFLRWKPFIGSVTLITIALQFFTKGGVIGIVVNFLTLDKWTAYYRTLVWSYGTINVAMHPWFGLVVENWLRPAWMPVSIDNYWLLIAMSNGVPEAVMRILLPVVVGFSAASRMAFLGKSDQRVLIGYLITIIIMTLMAFTVSLWGATQVWYYFLIGAPWSLAQGGQHVVQPADAKAT